MNAVARTVAGALAGTPFEGRAFLVGGCVRDELLGMAVGSDLDIVVEGDAVAASRLLWTKGVAESAPATYPRFGTAMVVVQGVQIEFASARKESYRPKSRKPSVEPASLLDDARRRDFTVNTLLRDLFTGEVRDLLRTGLDDLNNRVLRTPLDPVRTFRDDPLRILRAVRFRWKLGFDYAQGLADALTSEGNRLTEISGERVRDELVKMLQHPTAPDAVAELMDLRIMDVIVPEFRPMVGCDQGGYHHLDVWGHTLLALRNAGHHDLVVSLAVLLHDVGKPPTRSVDAEGRTRFFGHETVGADMARTILRRLRFGNSVVEQVATLVKNHMRLNSMPSLSTSAARRIVRDLGDLVAPWLSVIEADASALKPGVRALDLGPVREKIESVCALSPPSTLESPLSGEEIMGLTGLEPGAEIGRLKSALAEDVIEGLLAPGDKSGAKARLRVHWRNAGPEQNVAKAPKPS